MIWVYGLLTAIAILMIWQDIQNQTISLWCLALYAFATGLKLIFEPNPDGFWVAIIILLVFSGCQGILSHVRGRLAMGWGDLVLGPLCGLWLFIHEVPTFFISVGIMGFLTGLLWHYRWGLRNFPFIPSLLGGQGAIFLIRCFL